MRAEDNAAVAAIVRSVLPEFQAGGAGFADTDPGLDHLHEIYRQPGAAYFVVTGAGQVLGGGGVAPLAGGAPDVCELQKMYFLPALRRQGVGQRLLTRCLETARALGYRVCYLETLLAMKGARALYEKNGFSPIDKPMGATGHFGCDAWYVRDLG
jgi:putative acetyltransferase